MKMSNKYFFFVIFYLIIKNGIIVPYVEIVLPKDYLRTIVIGPTRKSEDTITSLRYFLRSKGYDPKSIGISSSKVPYRG